MVAGRKMNIIIVRNENALIPVLTPDGSTAGPLIKRGSSASVPPVVDESRRFDVGAEKTVGSSTSVRPQRIPSANRKAIPVLVTI